MGRTKQTLSWVVRFKEILVPNRLAAQHTGSAGNRALRSPSLLQIHFLNLLNRTNMGIRALVSFPESSQPDPLPP